MKLCIAIFRNKNVFCQKEEQEGKAGPVRTVGKGVEGECGRNVMYSNVKMEK
jgi:hypothetical protein